MNINRNLIECLLKNGWWTHLCKACHQNHKQLWNIHHHNDISPIQHEEQKSVEDKLCKGRSGLKKAWIFPEDTLQHHKNCSFNKQAESKVITMQNQVINMQTSSGATQLCKNKKNKKNTPFCIHGLPDEHNFCSHSHLSLWFSVFHDKNHAFLSRKGRGDNKAMHFFFDLVCMQNAPFGYNMLHK